MFEMLLLVYLLSHEWLHPPTIIWARNLGVVPGSSFFLSPHIHQCPFDSLPLIFLESPLCFYPTWALLFFRSSSPATGIIASASSSFASSQPSLTLVPPDGLFFFFLILAALGLCSRSWAFSSSGEQGPLFVAVRGLLTAVASLVAEHWL